MHVPSLVFTVLVAAVTARAQVGTDEAYVDPRLSPKGAISGAPLTPLPVGTTSSLIGGSDACSTAELISGTGFFPFDLTSASTGPEGQANTNCLFFNQVGIQNDVWFLWTATSSGTFQISTCSLTTVDTKIAVYSGSSCPPVGAFTPLTCGDDMTGTVRQSEVFLTCFFGDQFLIQLGKFNATQPGFGQFRIDRLPMDGPTSCQWDDGSAETGLRTGFGNNAICWMQAFGRPGDITTVTGLMATWGTTLPGGSALVNGQPSTVALWDDPDDDGDPNNAVLVAALATAVQNVDSDFFATISLPTSVVNGIYFLGVSVVNPPTIPSNYFPIPVDSTDCIFQPRLAWRASNTTSTFNFANLAGNSTPPAAYSDLATAGANPGLNGVLMLRSVCTTESPGAVFCTGDGLDAGHYFQCPCGNNGALGRGCAWSGGPTGARLTATGHHFLDTVRLQGSGMPFAVTAIYLQGDTLGDATFGDGVSCAGGALIRLRSRTNVAGASSFPDSTDTITLSQRGGVAPGSGVTRFYHAYYRNAATFCTPATFNVTNGWRVVW